MPVVMESSSSFNFGHVKHPCDAKQSLDMPSKINRDDADGARCEVMSAVSTMDTMPTLTDWPSLSHIPTANNPDDRDDWEDEYPLPDDKDDMNEIDANEELLACECSSDEGRRCEIKYSDFNNDPLSEPSCRGLNDPFLSELPPEPTARQKCSFPKNQNDEVGKFQKRFRNFSTRSGFDEQKNTKLFCNRLLRMTKRKQVEEEDPEVRFLAKISILTQIAQHADQSQDFFIPDSSELCHQGTAPMQSNSKSPTLKHGSFDRSAVDEAVEMDACAGLAGRASPKIAQHADQAWDSFTPRSKVFGCQDSAGFSVGCQASAPADDLKIDNVCGRQVTAPLSSLSRSLTLKQVPAHLVFLDEAREMGTFAGPPGRALRKIVQHADQAWDMSAASQFK